MFRHLQVVLAILVLALPLVGCNVVAVGHQDPAAKAEALAAFRNGDAQFGCGQGLSCAVKWSAAKPAANRLLLGERWDDVADVVLGAGYEQDLTWFYLGVAAEGMGQTRAARIYYDNAVRRSLYGAGYSCTAAGMMSCDGIRLPQDAQQLLAGLDRRGRGQPARQNPAARLGAGGWAGGEGARAYVRHLAQVRGDEEPRRADAGPGQAGHRGGYQPASYQAANYQAPAPAARVAAAQTTPAAPPQAVAAQMGGAKSGGAKNTAQPGG